MVILIVGVVAVAACDAGGGPPVSARTLVKRLDREGLCSRRRPSPATVRVVAAGATLRHAWRCIGDGDPNEGAVWLWAAKSVDEKRKVMSAYMRDDAKRCKQLRSQADADVHVDVSPIVSGRTWFGSAASPFVRKVAHVLSGRVVVYKCR